MTTDHINSNRNIMQMRDRRTVHLLEEGQVFAIVILLNKYNMIQEHIVLRVHFG